MASLADKAILSGADNCPPMLEKDMYDSWKSRMELYMLNRQHGGMILESVEQGPLLWPSVEVEGVTRLKKYSELSVVEAIQADCDVKATNIILISSDGFLSFILLVLVIMVTVIIVMVVLEIFVVLIVRVVIVVTSGWAYAFHQDKESLVRVPVENVTLSSSAYLLRENTDSVRSNQRMSPIAPSVPLKWKG
nr:hypothetical protein [Tanacetum cinerariifolium]